MNDTILIAVIVAFFTACSGLLGVFVGSGISIVVARLNLSEERRKSRLEYLVSKMEILVQCHADYEEYLAKNKTYNDGNPEEHARIIGKAISVCLSVADLHDKAIDEEKVLTYIAKKRLTRNFVKIDNPHSGEKQRQEIERWGKYQDRNRNALIDAIDRLAVLIEKVNR